MPPVTRKKGVLAFAKQASKGTPAAAPTYAVPKNSGGIKPMPEDEDLPLTSETGARLGRYRSRYSAGGTLTIITHAEPLGLLLYQAMGDQSVTGAGPYTHVFEMASDLPQDEPLTVWDKVGDDWLRFTDVYVPRLVLRAGSGENVFCEFDCLALDVDTVSAPAFSLVDEEPRFKFAGGTYKLEADATPPVEVDNCESVELVIDRAPDVRYAGSLTAVKVVPGRDVDLNVGIHWDSDEQGSDYFNAANFGAATGGGASQNLAEGSAELTFARHPALAGRFLRIATNGRNWEYGVERPDSDPGGGALEEDIIGILKEPDGGGTEVTITLVNETASEY